MNEVKIYGTDNCIYCLKLKNLLIKNNIEFTFVYVDTAEGLEEFKKVFNKSGVDLIPQATVNNVLLVPNKSFVTIEQAYEIIIKTINK